MQNSSYAGRHVFVGIEQKDRSAIHSTGDVKVAEGTNITLHPLQPKCFYTSTSPEFGGTLVWPVWNVVEFTGTMK